MAADPAEIEWATEMLERSRHEKAAASAQGQDLTPHDDNICDFEFTLALLGATGTDDDATVETKLREGLEAAAKAPSNKVKTCFAERIFRISDNVFLGSEYAAADGPLLRGLGITCVVNCVTEMMTGKKRMGNFFAGSEGMQYLRLNLGDSVDELPSLHNAEVMRATPVIEQWVAEGQKVLVHCSAGMSRSASVVIAWLMTQHGHSFGDAHAQVRDARGRDLDLRGVYYTSLYHLESPDTSTPPTIDLDHFATTVAEDLAFVGVSKEDAAKELAQNGWDAHAIFMAKMGD